MLSTLVESRPKRGRSGAAGLTSLIAHACVIGLLFHATGSAGPPAVPFEERDRIIFHPPSAPVLPMPSAPARGTNPSPVVRAPAFPLPIIVPTGLQDPRPFTLVGEFLTYPGQLPGSAGVEGAPGGPARPTGGEPHGERSVERPARTLRGSPEPRYPDALRRDRVEGAVRTTFVVDTLGRVETGSLRVLESAHPLFERAIRDVVGALRFVPAEAEGRRVRQLVEQSFLFRLTR